MSRRGTLRVYLGAAPGVGKTYAMLDEGQRRAGRGADVVVALVETHGRPQTEKQLVGLPVIARRRVQYRGSNLVENALRYTPEDRPVRLAASAHGDVVELRVIDRGPGIAADDRESVFAPFQRREDHATSGGAGVGLGLAIARGFVEAMHGTITLDDAPGGGLIAVVALPIVAPR